MLKSILKFILYIFLSLLLALIIRLFLCNFYRVPSDSMKPTILPGDFVLVDKWTYGARIFTRLKFDRQGDPPMIRMSGTGHIERNDVVVFNFLYRKGDWDTIRMNLNMVYMKRCIGLPGDTLFIVNGYYRIAGLSDTVGYLSEQKRLVHDHSELAPNIMRAFPFDSTVNWTIRNFGPLYVPTSGATISLNERNFKLYRKQITYETGGVVQMGDSSVYINDTLAIDYTFRYNWYFMAGDNVINSQDSRYIGLIPEQYIIGKASMVLSSKDPYTGKRRWNRMMQRIK